MTRRHLRVSGRDVDVDVAYRAGRVTVTPSSDRSAAKPVAGAAAEPAAGAVDMEAVHVNGPEWLLRDGERSCQVFVARTAGATWVHAGGRTWLLEPAATGGAGTEAGSGDLTAPMPATVLELCVREGDTVAAGAPLVVLSAMKMQIEVKSPIAGVVTRLPHAVGESVAAGAMVAHVEAEG